MLVPGIVLTKSVGTAVEAFARRAEISGDAVSCASVVGSVVYRISVEGTSVDGMPVDGIGV